VICRECGREFEPSMRLNKICSDECRFNRKNRQRRKPKIDKICPVCNTNFIACDNRRKYCSLKCKRSADSLKRKDFVQRRISRRISFRKLLPQYCEICGFDRVVQVCHINPISDGGEDSFDNTVSLCPNHHWIFDHDKLTKAEFYQLVMSYNADMVPNEYYM